MDVRQAIQQKAIVLLSRREYSARELQQKLLASHDSESVEWVIENLQQQGLQSDARFAEVWIRHRVVQGYGPLRVKMELREKGVSLDLIQQMLESETVDWFQQAKTTFQRRFGGRPARDVREKAKQTRFLQYRGFNGDQIRHALESDA